MPHFIVNTNAQSTGEHEVHNKTDGCDWMPALANQKDLGYHLSCVGAVAEAQQTYANSDGCYHCCKPCHSR